MYPLAHLAASLLLAEAHDGDRVSAAAGAIVPDLIDKTLAWVLGVTPSARHVGHSLTAGGALTVAAMRFAGRRRGVSLGASYLCHLVCDVWDGGHVPWLIPFRRYTHSERRWKLGLTWKTALLELAGMVILMSLATRRAAKGET